MAFQGLWKLLVASALGLCFAVSAQAGLLLVGNKSDHTLWGLDLASGEKQFSVRTGLGPHEVEVSPDGRFAVVSNYGSSAAAGNSLTVVDGPGRRVARTIILGRDNRPHGMAFLPDGRLVVTTEGTDHLLLVDVARGAVVRRIPLGAGLAHMVAVSHSGRYAWVTNISAGTLEKVDLRAFRVVGRVATGDGAEGLAVLREGAEIWVANRAVDTVSVVDGDSLEVLATLPSPGFPIRVAVTPDERQVVVSNARAATLSVFEVESRTLVATVVLDEPGAVYRDTLLGRAALPIGLAVDPDGSRVFVAISGGDQVAVVDAADWRVVARWPAGREPDALAVLTGGH
jgi:DNA-binding beta-propeller fold protein YncE